MHPPRSLAVLAAVSALTVASGCGQGADPIDAGDVPAITSPGTTIPYESGGADGSGSDGRKADERRGGVAAGPDSGSGG